MTAKPIPRQKIAKTPPKIRHTTKHVVPNTLKFATKTTKKHFLHGKRINSLCSNNKIAKNAKKRPFLTRPY